MKTREDLLKNCRRIVIKLGTNVLCSGAEGDILNEKRIKHIARQINDLREKGKEIIVVSSGAIGVGMHKMGFDTRPHDIPKLQALAAIGQNKLVTVYQKAFKRYGMIIAQLLLTQGDVTDRKRYINARHTFQELLDLNIVPIVNENDTVAVEEIKIGDNDNLSALVSMSIDADLLIILSDIDGLYERDPRKHRDAVKIDFTEGVPDIENISSKAGTNIGVGGIGTKLEAARKVTETGISMILANGIKENVIKDIFAGKDEGTYFMPICDRLSHRERWIAYSLRPTGRISVDKGAENALINNGKSLLPSGITEIQGEFKIGDAVCIYSAETGAEIARGLINYSAEETSRIKGHKTSEIEEKLGYKYYDEIIHRDNMVILGRKNGKNGLKSEK